MNASVLWHQGLSFTGKADTGFTVPLGADPKVGGASDGLRPMELMAMSLAGCTAMDVMSILAKKRQDITAFEVKVRADRADEHPRVFTSAGIEYEVTGHGIKESAVRRAIELSAVRYCPAQGMLAKLMPIRLHYTIYEGDSASERELVQAGEWTA
ncbi:MAG: OsmC family protein [Gemmatimonadetes bacterium]|nr:OsmC family protein [Gemmatimonadota bacterium]